MDPSESEEQPLQQEEFAARYAKCHLDLLRYILTLHPFRNEAEDVLQETARSLWLKADDYDPSQPFLPWARKFAYFEVLRHRKRYAVRSKYFADELIETLAAEREVGEPVLEEKREVLRICLGKLGAKARELLLVKYGKEKTLDAIAQEQGKTANALYLTMHRIRQKLVECVNQTARQEGLDFRA